MAHVVVASYRSKPGREADVAEHLRAMIAPTRAEPGCEAYRVVRAKNDPASLCNSSHMRMKNPSKHTSTADTSRITSATAPGISSTRER